MRIAVFYTSVNDIENAMFKARTCLSCSHGHKVTPRILPIQLLRALLISSAPPSEGSTDLTFDYQNKLYSDVCRICRLDIIRKLWLKWIILHLWCTLRKQAIRSPFRMLSWGQESMPSQLRSYVLFCAIGDWDWASRHNGLLEAPIFRLSLGASHVAQKICED